jgi:hypothetical protein
MNNVWFAPTQKGLLREMHYYFSVLCRGKVFSEKKAVIPNLLLAEAGIPLGVACLHLNAVLILKLCYV